MTDKQARFCEEYMVDLNATQAAIRAGYSENGAENEGYRLLRNDEVKLRIDQLKAERSARLRISTDYVVKLLMDVAETRVEDVAEIDEAGQIKYKPFSEWPDRAHTAVMGIEEDRIIKESADGSQVTVHDKIKIKTMNKDRSIENLGRHLAMFTDKTKDETERPPTEVKVIFAQPEDVTPS